MKLPSPFRLILGALFFLSSLFTHAANQPPERFLAFPDLTLARGETSAPIPLADHLRDPDVPGTAARITVRMAGQTRTIDLALHDAEAPLTVANFVAYVNAGRFAANFFHRSVPGFVIQNGGFYFVDDTTFDYVPTFAAVKNEPGRSNLRGTVAMAKLGGDPDSATSQWFINLADNSANLDAQNGGFTVFAHVLGDGMTVADAIAATPRYNASDYASAWTDLPLTAGFLARTNFIETDTAIIPALSHVVTSDDPDLVSATLENGALRLTASANRSGSTTIRLTTTDLEGGRLESSFAVTVAKAAQSITFTPPTSAVFGDAPLTLSATASSGLPVTLALVSGAATLSGNTLTLTDAGTVVLRATQAGNNTYEAAPAIERTIIIANKAQTITFNPIADRVYNPANNSLTLYATASSGMIPVLFNVISGPAFIGKSFDILVITGTGPITVQAYQSGNANYGSASATRTFTVAKADQTIAFTPPASAAQGDNPVNLSAFATSGLPVAFTLVSGPATLSGSTLTFTGVGNVAIRATQAGDNNYNAAPVVERTLTVGQIANAQITLQPRAATYTGAPQPALATTTPAGLRVTYTYKLGSAAAVATAPTLPGTYTVTATLDDSSASNKPTASATLTINKAPLTISAQNVSRAVGIANPVFSLSYSGLVGADTPATALTKTPVAATKATASSAPGSYPITLTGGVSNNYTLTLVPGTLTVVGFGGTYEALLFDAAALPAGKLTLTIPANALSYTGTLILAREAKAIPVKSSGTTVFVGSTDLTNASATWTRTTNGLDALSLALTVTADGTLTGNLNRNGEPFATLAHGALLRVLAKGQTATGANTLVLHPAYNLSDAAPSSFPRGSGFATAPIAAATGVMTLTGFTADGSPLTASLKPTVDDTYLLWVNPYGTRADSFLAGALPLEPHPESTRFPARAYIPRETGLLTWKKAALPANTAVAKLDKSYRAGFGPLGVEVSLDPWLPPATKAAGTTPAGTLAQRLGLAASATASGALNIAHGPADLDLGARESLLPIAATLNAAGAFSATNAAATAWTVKITPATGAFTGSFTLRDPAPTQTKPSATVDRKVTFSGVLRQAPADNSEVATGFFLVPGFAVPKGAAPTEQPSGEIRFSAP